MMKPEIQAVMNAQINEELFSAYLYAAMVNYFEEINLKGSAKWMRIQVQEELSHAQKFFEYMISRNAKITLKGINGPKSDWKSPLAAWEAAYKHECHITECVNKLYAKASDLKDPATMQFLDWFVNEQVEEEANTSDIVAQMKMVKDAPGGLFLLDRELSARTAGAAAGGGQPAAT
jgi:ferritin